MGTADHEEALFDLDDGGSEARMEKQLKTGPKKKRIGVKRTSQFVLKLRRHAIVYALKKHTSTCFVGVSYVSDICSRIDTFPRSSSVARNAALEGEGNVHFVSAKSP